MKTYRIMRVSDKPIGHANSVSGAIVECVRALRCGWDALIVPTPQATQDECEAAARMLGLESDPNASDMDRPVDANIVARDLAGL